MNIEEDFSSDTSDEDYVPAGEEAVSSEDEVENSEDETLEGALDEEQSDNIEKNKKVRGSKISAKRKRKSKSCKSAVGVSTGLSLPEDKSLNEVIETEDSKKKADLLWADFMKDVGKPQSKVQVSGNSVKTESSKCNTTVKTSEMPVSRVECIKEYDFAGETVRVSTNGGLSDKCLVKEVTESESSSLTSAQKTVTPSTATCATTVKRPAAGGGGLGSVLNMISKKSKISTLEKSKLDWNDFKKSEGIEEDLAVHNRGKQGYLERQAFLQRTDVRQFEQERDVRMRQLNMRK